MSYTPRLNDCFTPLKWDEVLKGNGKENNRSGFVHRTKNSTRLDVTLTTSRLSEFEQHKNWAAVVSLLSALGSSVAVHLTVFISLPQACR